MKQMQEFSSQVNETMLTRKRENSVLQEKNKQLQTELEKERAKKSRQNERVTDPSATVYHNDGFRDDGVRYRGHNNRGGFGNGNYNGNYYSN